MDLKVTSSKGVQVPEYYQNVEKIVIRTPSGTIDISSGYQSMIQDGWFPLVSPSEFNIDEENAENPELAPKYILFKEYGGEEERFEVSLNEV